MGAADAGLVCVCLNCGRDPSPSFLQISDSGNIGHTKKDLKSSELVRFFTKSHTVLPSGLGRMPSPLK